MWSISHFISDSDIPVFKKGEFLINDKEYMLGSAHKAVLVRFTYYLNDC